MAVPDLPGISIMSTLYVMCGNLGIVSQYGLAATDCEIDCLPKHIQSVRPGVQFQRDRQRIWILDEAGLIVDYVDPVP